jgi:hypothetical protein
LNPIEIKQQAKKVKKMKEKNENAKTIRKQNKKFVDFKQKL